MAKNIVEAVGVSSNTTNPSIRVMVKAMENAMSRAVLECYERGIVDPDLQRKAMQIAREKVRDAFAARLDAAKS